MTGKENLNSKMASAQLAFSSAIQKLRETAAFDQTLPADQMKKAIEMSVEVVTRPPIKALLLLMDTTPQERIAIMAKSFRLAADLLENIVRDPNYVTVTADDLVQAGIDLGNKPDSGPVQ